MTNAQQMFLLETMLLLLKKNLLDGTTNETLREQGGPSKINCSKDSDIMKTLCPHIKRLGIVTSTTGSSTQPAIAKRRQVHARKTKGLLVTDPQAVLLFPLGFCICALTGVALFMAGMCTTSVPPRYSDLLPRRVPLVPCRHHDALSLS